MFGRLLAGHRYIPTMPRPEPPLDPTFLITRDGDVELFKTPQEAAGWVEAVDVEDGEYTDCFRVNGERLELDIFKEEVHVRPTGTYDAAFLSQRLAELAERNAYTGDAPDPRTVANEVFAHQWKRRWPRWPKSLDRHLHGDGPPRIDSAT